MFLFRMLLIGIFMMRFGKVQKRFSTTGKCVPGNKAKDLLNHKPKITP